AVGAAAIDLRIGAQFAVQPCTCKSPIPAYRSLGDIESSGRACLIISREIAAFDNLRETRGLRGEPLERLIDLEDHVVVLPGDLQRIGQGDMLGPGSALGRTPRLGMVHE